MNRTARASWVLVLASAGLLAAPQTPATVQYVALVTTGAGSSTSIELANRSGSETVSARVTFLRSDGSTQALDGSPGGALSIPPSRSARWTAPESERRVTGYARIESSAPLEAAAHYVHPGARSLEPARTIAARTVSFPVALDRERNRDVELALLTMTDSGTHLVLTVRDPGGSAVAGGNRHIPLGPGAYFAGRLSEVLPDLPSPLRGVLTVERQWASFPAGKMAFEALEVDGPALRPASVTIVR